MRKLHTYLRLLLCAALVWLVLPASADTVIETRSSWTGKSFSQLGGSGMAAFGQTFVSPADPILQSFTVFIDEVNTTSPVRFRSYVGKWPEAPPSEHPLPPILFTSPIMASSGLSDGWQETSINTGGLLLVPGSSYIFFLGTYGLFDGAEHQLKMGFLDFNAPYSRGKFFFDTQAAANATLDQAFQSAWGQPAGVSTTTDLAFSATFSSVPEPSSTLLLLTALSLLCLFVRKS